MELSGCADSAPAAGSGVEAWTWNLEVCCKRAASERSRHAPTAGHCVSPPTPATHSEIYGLYARPSAPAGGAITITTSLPVGQLDSLTRKTTTSLASLLRRVVGAVLWPRPQAQSHRRSPCTVALAIHDSATKNISLTVHPAGRHDSAAETIRLTAPGEHEGDVRLGAVQFHVQKKGRVGRRKPAPASSKSGAEQQHLTRAQGCASEAAASHLCRAASMQGRSSSRLSAALGASGK